MDLINTFHKRKKNPDWLAKKKNSNSYTRKLNEVLNVGSLSISQDDIFFNFQVVIENS